MSDAVLNRILYAEDEQDIQTVARVALEILGGFTVEVCNNGVEVLEKAPAFSPDLILLDMMMPGMDGIATMQRLRDLVALASTPVIFMTAKVQPSEVQKYIELGAAGVIAKPFDPTSLADEIRAIWESSSAPN